MSFSEILSDQSKEVTSVYCTLKPRTRKWNVAPSLSNCMQYCFLRLYGMNLERSFRRSPQQACDDAIAGLTVIFAILSAALLAIPAAYFAPALLRPPHVFLDLVLLIIVVTFWLATRRYRQYASTPQIAERFRNKTSRRITRLLVLTVPALGLGLAIAVTRHLPL